MKTREQVEAISKELAQHVRNMRMLDDHLFGGVPDLVINNTSDIEIAVCVLAWVLETRGLLIEDHNSINKHEVRSDDFETLIINVIASNAAFESMDLNNVKEVSRSYLECKSKLFSEEKEEELRNLFESYAVLKRKAQMLKEQLKTVHPGFGS